jgi:hypothetical protein
VIGRLGSLRIEGMPDKQIDPFRPGKHERETRLDFYSGMVGFALGFAAACAWVLVMMPSEGSN